MEPHQPRLNIVLFEPQIPQNTGNIARTCACTGARLHLVGPMGFSIDDKKLKRAGLDYWHYLDITYYENTQEFLEKHSDDSLFFFTTKGRKVYSEQSYPDNCYLIFGREDAGHRRAHPAAPSRQLSAPADDWTGAQPEPVQHRCHRCVRDVASMGIPCAAK